MMMSLDTPREPRPLIVTPFNELNAEISPDGRWLAYESNESGDTEVYVRPFPNVADGRWQLSAGGGTKPVWARTGKEPFYLTPAGSMMAVPIEPASTFASGVPAKLFDGHYFAGGGISLGRTYDVTPDGQRFLMLKLESETPASLVVVQHWFSELRRLAPTQ